MKIMLKKIIILSILFFVSCGDESTFVSKIPEVTAGGTPEGVVLYAMGDHNYPPFEFNDANGNPEGFNVDIIRSVAKVMNLNIELKLGPWNMVRSKLENRKIDILIGMYKTPERMKKADFTIPHFITTYVIFTRQGSDIKKPQDIKGKTVLVQEGDLGHDFIKGNGTAGSIITKSEVEEILSALSSGEGDCAIAAVMQGQIIIQNKGIKNLKYIAEPLVQRNYCIAVKKGDAELLAKINEGLNVLKSTGEYDRIYEKWFGVYEYKGIISSGHVMVLVYVLAGLLAVIAGIYIWNISLKRKIREIETLFRTVFETSPYSISLSRADTTAYYMVNKAFEKLTGFSQDEVSGKTPGEIGIKMREADFKMLFDKLMREERVDNERIVIRNRSGEDRYCVISVVFITLRGEKFVLTMTADMTETRRLEEQLRQSQKMEVVGQLAGGVAHDFNNMLAGITGGAELLMRNIEPDSKIAKYADMILKGAERASELTTKLLAFSRMGKTVMKNIDIHETILSSIAFLERSIDKKISIITDFRAETHFVKGDYALLQNAILNLGLNARDAMADGGEIKISTENILIDNNTVSPAPELKTGLYIKIVVSDTGTGISPEIAGRIFEPFFTTKSVGKGTGLGLSAVYGTVHEHNGAIRVNSEPGRGSSFTIYFPAGDKSGETNSEENEELARYSGKVLVIDDEPLVRNTAEGFLAEMGFHVVTAESGIDGVKLYRERAEEISFVLLDMVMPGMSGQETLKALREINSEVKVIFSSGFTRKKVLVENSGKDDLYFVQKPYRLRDLSQAVKAIMAVK